MLKSNETYGQAIPPRFQTFSKKDAGRQDRPKFSYFPNNKPSDFNPELLKNPQKQNSIFVGDPMTLQRKFMVSPCPEDNVSAQMFAHRADKRGIFAQPYTAIPPNPLGKLAINLKDRLGNFGLADFSQKPFFQASMY